MGNTQKKGTSLMDFRSILNILLIALTLSTVVLTLIVYFIFKIRQGFPKRSNFEKHPLEGIYFKRVAPHLSEENEIAKKALDELKAKKQYRIKPWAAFLLVFGSIVFFLVIEKQLSFHNIIRDRIPEKKLIDELKNKGMFKEYQFKTDLTQDFLHYYQQETAEKTYSLLTEMRSKTIGLYSSDHSNKAEIQLWLDYLKSLGLNVIQSKKIAGLRNANILIIASTVNLEKNEIDDIVETRNQGKGLMMIGTVSNVLLAKLGFKNKIECNGKKTAIQNHQTSMILNAKSMLPWSLPLGAVMRLRESQPCDIINEGEDNNTPEIISEDFTMNVSKKVYANLLGVHPAPAIWINALPNAANINSIEDLFWSQTINFLAYPEQARIARWANGPEFIVSIAITGDSDYSNTRALKETLSKAEIPFTVFMTSETYSNNISALFKGSESIEIGSMGKTTSDLTKINLTGLFKNVQSARLDTEILAQTEVKGFRFPYDRFSWETISAIWQNRYQYILGVNDFSWHEPVPLAPNFYYIPNHAEEFAELSRRKDIASEQDFFIILENLLIQESRRGGHLIIKIDPDTILQQPNNKFLKIMVNQLESKKNNLVSLATSVQFAQAKREIRMLADRDGNLNIENLGPQTYDGIKFWTSGKLQTHAEIEKLAETEHSFLYKLKSLPPNKLVSLKWLRSP
jgi:peptidoglycan/xylan/chitin deacetylase (PgdA/CDA1 family)